MIDLELALNPKVVEYDGKKYEIISPRIALEVQDDGSRIVRLLPFKKEPQL